MSIKYAFILPTTECHSRCAHCFYEIGHSPRTEAVDYLEPLDSMLDGMVADGLQQVIITGGEPLLYPRLRQLVELCADKLVHILLITRGDDLDDEMLESLERWGVDDVTLSVTKSDTQLRALVNRVVFRSRYLPTLLTALTRSNVDQVGRTLELSSRLNLPLLFTPAFIPEDAPVYQQLSLRELGDEQWDELMLRLGPWAEEAEVSGYLSLMRRFYGGQKVQPGFCPMGAAGLVIDADGTVFPCFHRHDRAAGNLHRHSWEQIHQQLLAMRPSLISGPCFGEHCLSMFVGVQIEDG